jgi:hypothetical protein
LKNGKEGKPEGRRNGMLLLVVVGVPLGAIDGSSDVWLGELKGICEELLLLVIEGLEDGVPLVLLGVDENAKERNPEGMRDGALLLVAV